MQSLDASISIATSVKVVEAMSSLNRLWTDIVNEAFDDLLIKVSRSLASKLLLQRTILLQVSPLKLRSD
jgi:hypothetical protein